MMYKKWPSFDELKNLAQESPEKLEEFRKKEIQALIESAPVEIQKRLHGLQFQVDCQRQIHKTPMGSCVAISKMMHESFSKLNAVLNGKNFEEGYPERSKDNVVPFAG